jgi:hypothetical protein
MQVRSYFIHCLGCGLEATEVPRAEASPSQVCPNQPLLSDIICDAPSHFLQEEVGHTAEPRPSRSQG